MNHPTRFGLDNRGTKACMHCGVLSWASRVDEGTGLLCRGCYDAAGYENEHQDGYHADRREPLCPTCNPEREARRMAKADARVANYATVAVDRAAAAQLKETSYPHCPTCGQRRPKTKTWERTGVAGDCSDCKSDKDWIAFERTLGQPDTRRIELLERSLAARIARHGGAN